MIAVSSSSSNILRQNSQQWIKQRKKEAQRQKALLELLFQIICKQVNNSCFIEAWFCLESRDFSQTEKERTACKAEQSHKMTNVFTHNGPTLSSWVKMVVIF